MSGRRAELEQKRAKLEKLKQERERRRQEKLKREAEEAANRISEDGVSGVGGTGGSRVDIDTLFVQAGVAPTSAVLDKLPPPSHTSPPISTSPARGNDLDADHISIASSKGFLKRRKPELKQVTIPDSFHLSPKEHVAYDKQTQTTSTGGPDHQHSHTDSEMTHHGFEWDDEFGHHVLTYDDLGEDEDNSLGSLPHQGSGGVAQTPGVYANRLPPGVLHPGMPHVEAVLPADPNQTAKKETQEAPKPEPRELSEEEKKMIMLSEEFQAFFDKTSRFMERTLWESSTHGDLYIDYASDWDSKSESESKAATRLSLNREFFSDKWTKNRCVTCMDWSSHYPELLVASYNANKEVPHEPDGVVLVWNTKLQKLTPEYAFTCQSAVMSVAFAKFHPNLILGGTYAGQIVLWDNRLHKRTPVQRSPLSAAAHTHPVYCLAVVGSQNAHNLISVSTDGRVCTWSLDMLAQPQEILELQWRQGKSVATNCLSFFKDDINNFVVGSEEGVVFSACRHGSKAGILDPFESHGATITSVSTHQANGIGSGHEDFSHLFLSSSVDWTVKLWSSKEPRPIYTFQDSSNYILDVAWSPVHPALFSTVDLNGRLDLWNINTATEVPVASAMVEPNSLSRLTWTQSGQHLCVGAGDGKITVFDVGDQLAVPRTDEWNSLASTLGELREGQLTDDDILAVASGVGVPHPLTPSPMASLLGAPGSLVTQGSGPSSISHGSGSPVSSLVVGGAR
ncbi:unnamed protein product [Cyprideis torosa]|uniref:Uncharacterized protein n=1 Tax=Cyprideis torosa TaxID=163714 RepID=A0A7R8ZI42_9CRUS|nr:unnamed protein product [Cyprideis torosa]CAG0883965.1 unnamed protein product [Cyprideis torosa]